MTRSPRVSMLSVTLLIALSFVTAAVASRPQAPRTGSHHVATAEQARATVRSFFRALEKRRFGQACTLLGDELRAETGGAHCPGFLAGGTIGPLRWSIVGVRRSPRGMGVLVTLGQTELDRIRMRTWLAIVSPEHGTPKIIATTLVA